MSSPPMTLSKPKTKPKQNSEKTDSWKIKEFYKCKLSPEYFCKNYGWILDPAEGAIRFKAWPHLIDLFKQLVLHPLLLILKARQLGITWLMAHYALHRAIFYEGANVLILSKGEDVAGEVLSYCKFIHSKLPDFLKTQMGRDQQSLITFPALGSRIRALASTETSGIGYGGASLLILDENDFHKYAEQDFSEMKPMIDAGGNRQLVILSAVNKKDDRTKFKQLCRSAMAGESQFHFHFIPYDVMEYRDEKWYNAQFDDFEPWEVEARYPKTVQEALAPSKVSCYFDVDILTELKGDCINPTETRRNGMIKIFKPSVAGRKYCMVCDPSEGGDPFASGVMDWQSCELVATAHGKVRGDELAKVNFELYEEYNKAFIAVERNAGGVNLIDKLKAMGVSKWYMKDPEKHPERLGWYTGSDNRGPTLDLWREEGIYKRQARIYDKNAVDEHFSFIQEPGKEPRAQKGTHDDYVMMLSILWAIRKGMPHGDYGVRHHSFRR